MATFKSIAYVGSSPNPSAETCEVSVAGADGGDVTLLLIIVRDEEWNEGSFTMPEGWVNAIDADDPTASLYSDLHRVHVWRYDGAPPTVVITLSTLVIDYIVAAVLTLDEGEDLADFQFDFVRDTSSAGEHGPAYVSPGDGTLAAVVLREWLAES